MCGADWLPVLLLVLKCLGFKFQLARFLSPDAFSLVGFSGGRKFGNNFHDAGVYISLCHLKRLMPGYQRELKNIAPQPISPSAQGLMPEVMKAQPHKTTPLY